jgi:hypothetical protein
MSMKKARENLTISFNYNKEEYCCGIIKL